MEKEGLAWTGDEEEAGSKLRWAGEAAECDEELPAAFQYQGPGGGGGAQKRQTSPSAPAAPPSKKRKGNKDGSKDDDFETLKLVLRATLVENHPQGASSGELGWKLSLNRKAV